MMYLDVLKPTVEAEMWRNIPHEEDIIHSSMGLQMFWKINIKLIEMSINANNIHIIQYPKNNRCVRNATIVFWILYYRRMWLFSKHFNVSTNQICHRHPCNRRTVLHRRSKLNIQKPLTKQNVQKETQNLNQGKSQ